MNPSASKATRVAPVQAATYSAVKDQVPMMQYMMQRADPRVPGGIKLTIDIDDFTQFTAVAVIPYDGMREGDEVQVFFQTFVTPEEPIGHLPEMVKTLSPDDVGKPVVFKLNKSDLQSPVNLVGFYASFYFEVTPEQSETQTSKTQTVQILNADPISERLPAPSLVEDLGLVIYPDEHPDGVKVVAPIYSGMQIDDSVLLFDSTGLVADWQFVRKVEPLTFTLGKAWMNSHLSTNNLTVHMHFGREGRGLRSLPLPLKMARLREFPQAPEVPSPLTFYTARAGLSVDIPQGTDIGGGTTVMHIVGEDNQSIIHTSAFKTLNGRTSFTFASETLDPLLGLKTKVYFVHTSPSGAVLPSPKKDLTISLPGVSEQKYMPRLQCLEAQGRDELKLQPSGASIALELNGWPLMAVGQRVRVVLVGENNVSTEVVNKAVDSEAVSTKRFVASFSQEMIGGNKNITLRTTLYFNVPEGSETGKGTAALNDLQLSVVA